MRKNSMAYAILHFEFKGHFIGHLGKTKTVGYVVAMLQFAPR